MSIKFIVCAFDGVITDGTITVNPNDGHRCPISYHYKDAVVIKSLQRKGIRFGVITSSNIDHASAVQTVCNQMNFDCIYIGNDNKLDVMNRWIREQGITWDEVAYLGSYVDDYECMSEASVSGTTVDGSNDLSYVSDVTCSKSGGKGVLAEFIDNID